MRNIFVVTHTQSQHHVEGRVGGWYDTSLTEFGLRQADAVAHRLARIVPPANANLISSDLKRAYETADIIGKALDLRVLLDPGFREISYGMAEGQTQDWLSERMSPAPHDNRLDHSSIAGGETKRTFISRIYESMSRLPARETTVIVTHGYALTFAIAYWIGLPIADAGYVNFAASPGGITHLNEDDYFENRAVKHLNDTSHLVGLKQS